MRTIYSTKDHGCRDSTNPLRVLGAFAFSFPMIGNSRDFAVN